MLEWRHSIVMNDSYELVRILPIGELLMNMQNEVNATLNRMVGETIESVSGNRNDSEFVVRTTSGLVFTFLHYQDCCEDVYLEEIIGDIDDLIGHTVVMAEETSNSDLIVGSSCYQGESFTWTYYRMATERGLVVLRFFGSSNGYYAESVSVSVTQQ